MRGGLAAHHNSPIKPLLDHLRWRNAVRNGSDLLVLLDLSLCTRRYSNTNRRKPTKLPQGFFAWMGPLMAYDDNDIAEIAGASPLPLQRPPPLPSVASLIAKLTDLLSACAAGIDALTYLRLQWFGAPRLPTAAT